MQRLIWTAVGHECWSACTCSKEKKNSILVAKLLLLTFCWKRSPSPSPPNRRVCSRVGSECWAGVSGCVRYLFTGKWAPRSGRILQLVWTGLNFDLQISIPIETSTRNASVLSHPAVFAQVVYPKPGGARNTLFNPVCEHVVVVNLEGSIRRQTMVSQWYRLRSLAIIFVRMVRWCIRLTRLTLVCEVIRYRLVQVRQNQKKKKRLFGLAARNRLSLSLPLSFSPLSYCLSFSMQKSIFRKLPTPKPVLSSCHSSFRAEVKALKRYNQNDTHETMIEGDGCSSQPLGLSGSTITHRVETGKLNRGKWSALCLNKELRNPIGSDSRSAQIASTCTAYCSATSGIECMHPLWLEIKIQSHTKSSCHNCVAGNPP